MSNALSRCLIAALVLLATAAASAQPHAALDSLARAAVAEHGLPSVVIGVSVNGQRHVAAAGAIDSLGTAPDARTFYEIGSISKVLTGIALADAVVRGETTLETPVRDLLPDSAMVAQHESGPIRLWHLTTHSSGLPSFPVEIPFAPGFDMADPYARFDLAALLGALDRPRVMTAPGEAFAYSNMAVGLLGHVLGRQAGTTYDAFVSERVLGPLGLAETLAEVPDSLAHRFPGAQGGQAAHWTFTEATMAAGGWRSTAADMLTLGEAAVDPTATPLADALALSLTPRFEVRDGVDVGLGWFLAAAPGSDARMAQHSGGTGGFRSFLAVVPEAGIVVVALTNSDVGVDAVGADVLRRLLATR